MVEEGSFLDALFSVLVLPGYEWDPVLSFDEVSWTVGFGMRMAICKVGTTPVQTGLAMPPEILFGGFSELRVRVTPVFLRRHLGGSEAAGGKRRDGRGEGADRQTDRQ